MDWVTRERPKTDRIACPWLIKRFIDRDATFHFTTPDNVLKLAQELGGKSFDAPGADYTHVGNDCSFETLIKVYRLTNNAALSRLAKIVHAADIVEDQHTDPFGAALLALGEGGLLVYSTDNLLLYHASFVYDALYEWCKKNDDAQGL